MALEEVAVRVRAVAGSMKDPNAGLTRCRGMNVGTQFYYAVAKTQRHRETHSDMWGTTRPWTEEKTGLKYTRE